MGQTSDSIKLPLGQIAVTRVSASDAHDVQADRGAHAKVGAGQMRGKRIGEILVAHGRLDREVLEDALRRHQAIGCRLSELLVAEGRIGANDVVRALSEQSGIPYVSERRIARMAVPDEAVSLLPADTAERLRVLPVALRGRELICAVPEPRDLSFLDELKFHAGVPAISGVFATNDAIRLGQRRFYHGEACEEAGMAAAALAPETPWPAPPLDAPMAPWGTIPTPPMPPMLFPVAAAAPGASPVAQPGEPAVTGELVEAELLDAGAEIVEAELLDASAEIVEAELLDAGAEIIEGELRDADAEIEPLLLDASAEIEPVLLDASDEIVEPALLDAPRGGGPSAATGLSSRPMTIRKIATIGHPVLRQKARPVTRAELETPAMQAFIDDLIETMRDANGAGLAANQVYEPIQITVIEVGDNPRYPYKPKIPLTVLVNPVIEPLDDETFDNFEGCLSVPDLRGVVPRHTRIRVRAMDRHGNPIDQVVQGLTAGTYQHECDHLLGKLFLDRVRDTTTLCTWKEFERHHRDAFVERVGALVARFGA